MRSMATCERTSRVVAWGRRIVRAVCCGRCAACGGLLPARDWTAPVCPDCAKALAPRLGGYCPRCGSLAEDPAAPVTLCTTCRGQARPWDGLAFHAPYAGLLRDLVLAFKFHGRLGQGRVLADLCLAAYGRALDDGRIARADGEPKPIVVPVPLHPKRLAWRGFNQSLELGRVVGRAFDLAVQPEGMRRIRHTTPQSSLPGAQRRDNIAGAFRAAPEVVDGRSILLIDDVMTTGATVETAARALRQAGAVRVDVLVVAR